MIKMTKEMVSKMGKEITGKQKGQKCNSDTFNKINKVMNSIYGVMYELFDLDSEAKNIKGVMVSFGSDERLKLIFQNDRVEITNKSKFDEEFKGFIKYSIQNKCKFNLLLNQKVKNLNVKKFLNNVIPVLFEECKKKNDYVIYDVRVKIDEPETTEKQEQNQTKTRTDVKFRKISIFNLSEAEDDFKLHLHDFNVMIIHKDNTVNTILNGEVYNNPTLKPSKNKVAFLSSELKQRKRVALINYSDDFRDIIIKLMEEYIMEELYLVQVYPDKSSIKDYISVIDESSYVYEFDKEQKKFSITKRRTDEHPLLKDEDIKQPTNNFKYSNQQPVPQIILSEYLTEQAIQIFTKQAWNIVDNYDVFSPNVRQYNMFDGSYIPELCINNFLNIFVYLNDFHPLDDIGLDVTDFDFNINENMEGTIKSKSGTYKEVIEKIDDCNWGSINEGCYCITQCIDPDNPYYPILKVYTFDNKDLKNIHHIEMYINGKLIKRVEYGFDRVGFFIPNSIYIKTFDKLNNRGFDVISTQFTNPNPISRIGTVLIFKSYEKDGCVYTFNTSKDEIFMNDKEKELHLCQNQLKENAIPRK